MLGNSGKSAGKPTAGKRGDHGFANEVIAAFEHLGDSKPARKAAKKGKKEEKSEAKHAKKVAKTGARDPGPAEAESSHLTAKKARNAISVAKVVVPAAVPVLAPFAVRAAGSVREAYDRYQARKLGVDVDRLAEFTGRGAALHARIAGLTDGITELRQVNPAQPATAFADEAASTLRQLTATVRAAEHMPAPRRKAAYRAVSAELDTLEDNLLTHLRRQTANPK